MEDRELKIVLGGLLHDIGKVLYRASDGRNHSVSGYDFLKNEAGLEDQMILDQVRYHHAAFLKGAKLESDSPAYITYMADNIAAAVDRRENDGEETGFDKTAALESIFNILNGNQGKACYAPRMLEQTGTINYPLDDKVVFDEQFYQGVERKLKEILIHMEYRDSYINSLLEVMEATLTYVPSSTSKKERADISLFDHVKLTAAFGSCIYQYLKSSGETDFREKLFLHAKDFYDQKIFLLFSMDISGIQSFIYDIQSKDALKNLRARSFYLEVMMENAIDELLDMTGTARTNLIYSGGGHAYILLANTNETRNRIQQFGQKMNDWLLEYFQTDLYIGIGYATCSSMELQNCPKDSYRAIFGEVARQISEGKKHRYSASKIQYLNTEVAADHKRECRICHRSDHLTKDNLCEICSGLIKLSRGIQERAFFTIISQRDGSECVPIFDGRYLCTDSKEKLLHRMKTQHEYIRSYSKNAMYIGDAVSTKLWVGDYKSYSTFEEIVRNGTGIHRLGVLRADVDNLGKSFVAGFRDKDNGDRYVTLSRTAAFSRKLSLFFKLHVNDILEHGTFSLTGEAVHPRNAAVVYSGGDDLFIVGAWKDVLEFAVDLHYALKKFTQETLTISAGFGIFPEKYPIIFMADQTGRLESISKQISDGKKNAITLFNQDSSYHWDELIESVIGEKYMLLYEFFTESEDRGKNFLYNLLELFRNQEERLNIARLAYFLARLEPGQEASEDKKQLYRKFADQIYQWRRNQQDSRELITAIYIYAYLTRQEEEH